MVSIRPLGPGHSAPTDSAWLSLEKWPCGAVHRHGEGRIVVTSDKDFDTKLTSIRQWYNHNRPHDRLQGRTPAEVWEGDRCVCGKGGLGGRAVRHSGRCSRVVRLGMSSISRKKRLRGIRRSNGGRNRGPSMK
ncbi:MAG: hypothetical protein EHM80_10665 [Nitrospiraceae bacterium]|nr:MAG: hypothetical protein EHM80_10665 [Nitrospiraceae bacterium]